MESNINIEIKIPDIKKNFTITMPISSLISDLKKKIEELSGISPIAQKLILKGKILREDSSSLSSLNITSNCTMIVLRNKNISPQNNNNNNPLNNMMNNNPLNNMMNNPLMNNPQISQMLQNPQYRQMMNQLLQDPNGLNRLMRDPRVRQMMNANPQTRALMQNPEMMRNMMNMMRGGMNGLGGNNMFNPYNAFGTPTPNLNQMFQDWLNKKNVDNNNINNSNDNTGNNFQDILNNMMRNVGNDRNNFGNQNFSSLFSAIQNQQNMNQGNNSQNNSNVNYKELYKDQLEQLKDMGFFDEQKNLQALIICQGNLQFAVDRIVNDM